MKVPAMSLFPWIRKKNKSHVNLPTEEEAEADGQEQSSLTESSSEKRKSKRLERREQLYKVVRDAMTRSGILSAEYKFKVLSMDAGGGQYLVMVDCHNPSVAMADRLNAIEAMIAKAAMNANEIEVTAMYWRFPDGAPHQSAETA
jgi:hypothetical protein